MLKKILLLLFFISQVAQAKTLVNPAKRCQTQDANFFDLIIVETQLNFRRQNNRAPFLNLQETGTIIIPVFFHVIAKGEAVEDGKIPLTIIDEQIKVLNQFYQTMGVQFILHKVDYTIDKNWFQATYGEDLVFKQKLRQGGRSSLNIYALQPLDQSLGWSHYPWEVAQNLEQDGVIVHQQALPGGAFEAYNQGKTLVHEVGHWLGLYHTFEGGCGGGDLVSDTPPQNAPTFGCPEVATNSCPESEGVDSITNFMDYSDDVCLSEFSPGQSQRVREIFHAYRFMNSLRTVH